MDVILEKRSKPGRGELKEVKVGFSWTLLFLSPIFGIPLFMRGLSQWGQAMFVLAAIQLPELFIDTEKWHNIALIGTVLAIGCAIYLGFKGNEITAKHLLDNGWDFAEDDNHATQLAKMRWSVG